MIAFTHRLAAVALLGFLLAACGSEESAPTPDRPSRETVATRGMDDTTVMAEITRGTETPAGLPAGYPIYPGAEPAGSMAVPGAGAIISYTSSARASDVTSFYRKELESAGWTVTDGPGQNIDASKGDLRTSVVLGSGGGKTQITIKVQGG